MQIDTSTTVAVTSTLTTPTTAMTLDQDGMAHLMSVLTNLYADKHLAVLREYSTNALDSHVAAGNPAPVEVSLPTALNPTLVITDHGIGLSRDDIVNVYAKYGASTKRGTNTQVGSFGLGAKSAFTIGGQFVVTATKDGRRTAAVFALDADGVGSVSILAEHPTPDANGVTVSIAVSNPRPMQQAAAEFFRAWRPGTVLVDGREPDSYFTDPATLWLGDDVLYTRSAGITVVMGSVAYPLPSSAVAAVRERTGGRWHSYGDNPGLTVFLPIGAVDITPSREGIRDTERSIAAVSAVLANLPARFADRLHAVQQANPDTTAMVLAARPYLAAADNLRVPVSTSLPGSIVSPTATSYSLTGRGGLRAEALDVVSAATLHLFTVLVGVPKGRSAKRAARQWLEQHGSRRMLVQFGDGADTSGVLDWLRWGGDSPLPVVHFDSIKLPPRATVSGSKQVQYKVHLPTADGSGHLRPMEMTVAEIKAQALPVAYLSPGGRPLGHDALAGYLLIEPSTHQSLDVLVRRLPGALSAANLITAWRTDRIAGLPDLPDLIHGMHMAKWADSASYVLGDWAGRITHPTWLAAFAAAARFTALSTTDQSLVIQHTGGSSRADRVTATDDLRRDLPLLMHLLENSYDQPDAAVLDHLVTYVNTLPAVAA